MSNKDSNIKIEEYQMGRNHIIESLWLSFYRSSHGQWILKIKEAVRLYEKIKELQPKHILELGTGVGCSTAIMAFACPEARIYTVESNKKCLEAAKKLIPSSLQDRIHFHQTNTKLAKSVFPVNPLVYWSVYDNYDWIDYDFVLIDGPGPFLTDIKEQRTNKIWKALADQPNGDLIFMLPLMKEGTLVYIDGRHNAVNLYLRHLGIYLELVEPTKELEGTKMWDSSQRYIIFKRTSKSLVRDLSDFVSQDLSYKVLDSRNYFNENS